ncbi:MAG: hypothetical protein M1837_005907 [Sclerophora amabilis]|nr:MAG: hypothetical protein M1837_005907 [Sclerophora amabilis]
MEPSPLTQQARPEAFQPKIVKLYQALFKEEEDVEKGEGFWREFFLLRPDKSSLERVLADLSGDDLLHFQSHTRLLFSRSIENINNARPPSDEIALDTLTAFLGGILSKKYTNPSSDIISVLTGLDQVDAVFTDFVLSLDVNIRSGRSLDLRKKAVEAALSITAGAYQTSLLSFFTHRDLFPSLVKYIQDADVSSRAFEPFLLLGLLANYNKFEFQNPYRLRLEDFVNEGTIQKIIRGIGISCARVRDGYVAVQDDLPEGWTFNSTLAYFGLGVFTMKAKNSSPAPSPEALQSLFAALPTPESSILLGAYDFANANKLFCFNLVSLAPETKHGESPFSAYLSLTSYLSSHAHRSSRTSLYAYMNLLVIRLLLEDQVLFYHWSELWRALLTLIRFLTTYASDLHSLPNVPLLLDSLVNLIALSLSAGDAFLPGAAEYDDLFYKLVETGDILTKFRDAYNLSARPTNSLPTLLSICAHYDELLTSQRTQSRSKNLSPAQVNGVIKSGYETLSITAKEGLDGWERYREADERMTLKKVARVAVADVRALLAAR